MGKWRLYLVRPNFDCRFDSNFGSARSAASLFSLSLRVGKSFQNTPKLGTERSQFDGLVLY